MEQSPSEHTPEPLDDYETEREYLRLVIERCQHEMSELAADFHEGRIDYAEYSQRLDLKGQEKALAEHELQQLEDEHLNGGEPLSLIAKWAIRALHKKEQ